MSYLIYNGVHHTIELTDKSGKSKGKWTAFNNIDSKFATTHYHGLPHLRDGVYAVLDGKSPHRHHHDYANGSFGSYGIIRFNYPGHPGVGVHSGRVHAAQMPGAQHATHGCVRTTNHAMALIKHHMSSDPITNIRIQGNSVISAQRGIKLHGATIGHK
jgi:hypothetical protein